jgi:hypothetical protein
MGEIGEECETSLKFVKARFGKDVSSCSVTLAFACEAYAAET